MPHDETNPHPLGEGEFIHFEYLHFDPDDPETGFSNYVEISHDRRMAQDKAYLLLGDPKVWALHIRRYEQPEQGVHLYDETQHLAKAQNVAFRERKRAETLQKLLGAAVESNHRLEREYERAEASYETRREADDAVIMHLHDMLEAIRKQASDAQRDAVFLEPADIARMARLNLQALRESELRKAKARRRTHVGDRPWVGGEPDSAPEPADPRLCVKCGQDDKAHIMWAQRHLPKFPEDMDPSLAKQRTRAVYDAIQELHPEPESLVARTEGVIPESVQDTPEAEQSPNDECVCSHERHQHYDGACQQCSHDVFHEFKLAVL